MGESALLAVAWNGRDAGAGMAGRIMAADLWIYKSAKILTKQTAQIITAVE